MFLALQENSVLNRPSAVSPRSQFRSAFTCWTEYSALKIQVRIEETLSPSHWKETPASSFMQPESYRGLRTKTRPSRGLVHRQLRSDEADSTISRGLCGTITPPPKNMCPTCPTPPLFDRKLWEEWTRWLHRASTTRAGSPPKDTGIWCPS